MTTAEWESVVKRRLLSGWVLRSSETLDDAGYFSWLRPFTLEAINEALDALSGTDWMPKANEIVRRIQEPSLGVMEASQRRAYEAYECRHRAAGSWLVPLVDPETTVEKRVAA